MGGAGRGEEEWNGRDDGSGPQEGTGGVGRHRRLEGGGEGGAGR